MKILYVTTISQTMNSFFKPHIKMLVEAGHQVDIACNYNDLALDGLYSELGCNFYQIDFSRSPLSPSNLKAYGQLKNVVKNGGYDIVHCHTPNAAVVTRLVCRRFRRKNNLKVFYTAHGFHFYKGAPIKNWLVYYPIEKVCSCFTDVLITMNKEDYNLAVAKMKAKSVKYVHGVGVDLTRFENIRVNRTEKRLEIGVPEDAFLLISVGELNENKNHQVIIKAIAELNNPSVHYAIAGKGARKEYLEQLAGALGVSEQLHLLGYRRDIPELNTSADAFCFPSFREGLPIAPMEAMACGLPIVCSAIRGNVDLIDDSFGHLVETNDVSGYASAIKQLIEGPELCKSNGEKSVNNVLNFSTDIVMKEMLTLYRENLE